MDRVSALGYQTVGSKRYYQDINLGSGIQGTDWAQLWANGVQENIVGAEEAFGLTPTDAAQPAPDSQLTQAIARAGAANVTSVTASGALTADNAGLVLVSAAAGNIAITMPASASAAGRPLRFQFVRTDATTNTVTISFFAGDVTLLGALAGPQSLSPLGTLTLVGDGAGHWVVAGMAGVAVFGGAGTSSFTVPAGVTLVEADVTGGGGGSGSCASGQGAGGAGAGGTAIKNCVVTPGQVITVTVGAAGAAGVGGNGGNGGTSSFGSFCSATGGLGGAMSNSLNSGGGIGGIGSGGDINIAGGCGSDGQTSGALSPGGNGGASRWGGGGRGASGGGTVAAGQAPGSGAGGPYNTASNGEPGATGIVIGRWKS